MSFLCKLLEILWNTCLVPPSVWKTLHAPHTHQRSNLLKVVASCSWQSAAWALQLEVTVSWFWRCQHLKKWPQKLQRFERLQFDIRSFICFTLIFEGFATHVRFERWHGRHCQRCLCGRSVAWGWQQIIQTWRLPNVPTIPSPLRWWFAYNLYQLNLLVANLLGYVGIHFGKVGMDVTWSDHLPADHSCCFWAVKEHL